MFVSEKMQHHIAFFSHPKNYLYNLNTVLYKLPGTKIDLREEDPECISFAEGKKLKQKIRAARYVECSAIKGEGLQDVFTEAIRAVMKKPPTVRRACSFL